MEMSRRTTPLSRLPEQVCTSVFEDVEREAAESAAALVARAHPAPTDAGVPTSCSPAGGVGARGPAHEDETAGEGRWGSNPGIMKPASPVSTVVGHDRSW